MLPAVIDAEAEALEFPELVNIREQRAYDAVQIVLGKDIVFQVIEVRENAVARSMSVPSVTERQDAVLRLHPAAAAPSDEDITGTGKRFGVLSFGHGEERFRGMLSESTGRKPDRR